MRKSKATLDPLQKGEAFIELRRYGWSDKSIAAETGFTVRYVQMLIDVAARPKSIQEMIKAKLVSPTLAYQTLQKDGPHVAALTLQAAVDDAVAARKIHEADKYLVTDRWVKAVRERREASRSR